MNYLRLGIEAIDTNSQRFTVQSEQSGKIVTIEKDPQRIPEARYMLRINSGTGEDTHIIYRPTIESIFTLGSYLLRA